MSFRQVAAKLGNSRTASYFAEGGQHALKYVAASTAKMQKAIMDDRPKAAEKVSFIPILKTALADF